MSSKGVAAMFSYIREELLLEKYIEVKSLFEQILPKAELLWIDCVIIFSRRQIGHFAACSRM